MTPRGVHSMFAIVELMNLYVSRFEQFGFFIVSNAKENVKITFAMMRHLIFLMRFTPEERAIVLEMAKNCLSKHNLTFSFSFNATEKHENRHLFKESIAFTEKWRTQLQPSVAVFVADSDQEDHVVQ